MKDITLRYHDKLPLAFYKQKNVCIIAKALIGKVLVTSFNNMKTVGRIVETEAYNGIVDKASHSWNGRRTVRTEVMYAEGGLTYVYLCYGIHHLINVVTNEKEIPQVVLIRAIEPLQSVAFMLLRTGKQKADFTLTNGPGKVSKAMGITNQISGMSLQSDQIFIANDNYKMKSIQIKSTTRIGVEFAEADAKLPYRFVLEGNPFVSRKK